MECLGLQNKPKAEVHPGHKLTGPKEEEEEGVPKCTIVIRPVPLCEGLSIS
jgi:hypothetical protein